MTRLLFVVSRDEPERYEWLRAVFAKEPVVEIALDRRQGDRRRDQTPAAVERRVRERRTHTVEHELSRLGYVLIRRSP